MGGPHGPDSDTAEMSFTCMVDGKQKGVQRGSKAGPDMDDVSMDLTNHVGKIVSTNSNGYAPSSTASSSCVPCSTGPSTSTPNNNTDSVTRQLQACYYYDYYDYYDCYDYCDYYDYYDYYVYYDYYDYYILLLLLLRTTTTAKYF